MAKARLSRRATWGIGIVGAALIGLFATPFVLQWLKDRELHDWLTLSNAPEVMRMLRKGADDRCSDIRTGKHWPLSEFALRKGSPEMLSLLAARGRRFDEAELGGQTPLMIAVVAGNLPGVRFALERGASVNARAWTPVEGAVSPGGPETGKKSTPLIAAVAQSAGPKEMQPIIETLLAAGAKVNDVDDDGRTPLMMAVEVCSLKSVQRLLQASAKIDATDSQGRAALHRISHYSDYPKVLELLLRKGANANLRDKKGRTPLHEAVAQGSPQAVSSMIEHGADPALADGAGVRPRDLVNTLEPATFRPSMAAALAGKWRYGGPAPPAAAAPPNSLSQRVETLLN